MLYRVAEVMEGRRDAVRCELRAEPRASAPPRRGSSSTRAIDRLVWYAGWADKIAQVVGGANPVAGPFFNLSAPEPTGVVAVVAPQESACWAWSAWSRRSIVTGNTAVVIASEAHPLPAITLAEVLATSDVPGGVVNILTGASPRSAPWLASHMDVNAIDLTGVAGRRPGDRLEVAAADNLKRVRAPRRRADWPSTRPRPDDGLPGDQDRLAPDRGLT